MFPDIEALKKYFEKSMDYFNNYSRVFRKQYPHVAQALDITESKVGDPDVLRLFEAFALFDARLNWNIDQNKHLIGDFLLSIICPEILYPVPSACILEFGSVEGYGVTKVPKLTEVLTNNNCKFRTGMDFELFHGKIEKCEIVDTRQFEQSYSFKNALSITLKVESYCASIALYFNLEYDSAARMISFLINAPVYLNGEKIGFLSMPEDISAFGSSAICGNPFYEVYEYRVLKEKYCFLNLTLLKPLDKGVYKLLLPGDQISKMEIHSRMILANCLPVVNLFRKKSDPIKLDLTKDEYELFSDIDKELYKINSIENLYMYGHSEGLILLEANKDYFTRRDQERLLFSIKSKFDLQNAHDKTIYADLLCSNGAMVNEIKLGELVSVDRYPWLKANILTKPTNSMLIERSNKWSFLSLFTENLFLKNDTNLLELVSDMCKLYEVELTGIVEISKKHSYGIRKTDFMWNSVFPKDVFEIKVDDDQGFMMALLWARILKNCCPIGSICEIVVIFEKNNVFLSI